jgi:uncharacterized membrane protein SpoIIM required for sporulation
MLDEVKEAFSENRIAILAATAILLVSFVLGYILEPNIHGLMNPFLDEFVRKIKEGVITLTFQSIFLNNIKVVLLMFIMGPLLCFSAIILAFNGFFVGYFVATTDNLAYTMLLIVPHGIFEFSSCIIACASGFVLLHFIVRFIRTLLKHKDGSIGERLSLSYGESYIKLKQALILLVVSSVLMVIAGFVEVYLTIHIADSVMAIFG